MKTLTLSERLEIFKFANKEDVDYKDLLEALLNLKKPFDAFKRLERSVKEGYISAEQFMREEYISDTDYFYNEDDYVYVDDEVITKDDAGYCEYYGEWCNRGDVYQVYIGRHERYYSMSAIERESLYCYDGDYYDYDALSRNDLVLTEEGDVMHNNDAYYWDSDNCWHSDEEDSSPEYIRTYHNNNGIFKRINFSENPKFFIGYEIEKEDKDVKESIEIDDFEDKCPKWRKERDGSLDDDSGFELVSPTFELDVEKIFEHINANQILKDHINAEKGLSCGGHINVSEAGLSGEQLFDKIKGYTPLFHALYYKRIDKDYSKGKSNKDLKRDNEKYQSVRIHDNRIEYRIISAVPDITTLRWRTELIELILNNPTDDPKQAFFNLHSIFLPHIKKMYQTERLEKLIQRVVKFTNRFEGIVLDITEATSKLNIAA